MIRANSPMMSLVEPLRVLLVDDNPLNLTILRRTLQTHFSHLVTYIATASGGVEAIEMITDVDSQQLNYDIIFLDIDMPDMSGVEVAKRIRNDMNDFSTIIVAVTTSDSEEQRLKYNEVGMDGCCKKPVLVSALSEVISQALQSRKSISSNSSLATPLSTPAASTEDTLKDGIIDAIGIVEAFSLNHFEEPVVVPF